MGVSERERREGGRERDGWVKKKRRKREKTV